MWNIKIFSALITVAVPDSKRDQLSPQRGRLLNKMSLELRWLHLLLHFKILPTQHLRKQLATVCPMVRVLVYSYEDKALGSNVIIRACVKLFVVFTTGENGDFRYKAMCLYLTSSSLIQHFHELAKFHACSSIKIHNNLSEQLTGTSGACYFRSQHLIRWTNVAIIWTQWDPNMSNIFLQLLFSP